jgi:molybdopterin molybdotransferase
LSFEEARATVLQLVRLHGEKTEREQVELGQARGRVLATKALADRDDPPLDRALRDGYALRAADTPGTLKLIGEVRAGAVYPGEIPARQAVEIMTGAPVPAGADAVVMLEQATLEGRSVRVDTASEPGAHINRRGAQTRRGDMLLKVGTRLEYAEVALLAATGAMQVVVYRKPRVAILTTGDEVVEASTRPLPHQVRNSNAWSLAAQVERAGGEPLLLGTAPDALERTVALIGEGLKADLLLIAGGVSAGRYDVVEDALARWSAEVYFDQVQIQPGRPLVFGRAQEKLFFGLPGNPVSTMVCFELFARAAVELLGGQAESVLPLLESVLTEDFRHEPGLMRFLPARLSAGGSEVTPVDWHGSGDIAAVCRGNCFLVAEADTPEYRAGERIRVLPR